jgi:hypothetical protein
LLGVFDETTSEPIPGVRVLDLLTSTSALTTRTGTVSLVFLQEGGGLIRVQKIGYEQQTLTVVGAPRIRGASASRVGHVHRRGRAAKKEGRPLGNLLLGRAAGVKLACGAGDASFLMPAARCASGGPPQVYLDGVPPSPTPIRAAPRSPSGRGWSRGEPVLPVNLNEFDVSTLGAVELYSTNDLAPIEFAHTSDRRGACRSGGANGRRGCAPSFSATLSLAPPSFSAKPGICFSPLKNNNDKILMLSRSIRPDRRNRIHHKRPSRRHDAGD